MKELKVSTGIWFLGATSDRFVKQVYRPDTMIEERFKLAAAVPGVSGLEMHYPSEVTDANYKDLKKLADDLGMKIVQFCPHHWIDPRWKFGQFSNPDPQLRQQALDLANRTTDLAQLSGSRGNGLLAGPGWLRLSVPDRPPPAAGSSG